MRQPAVPYLEPLVAASWWAVGAAALAAGTGTVLLAAGLGLTAALLVVLHRRHGSGARLRSGERGAFLRTVGITAVLIAVTGTVLGLFGLGELSWPVICALVGLAAISLSRVLGERSLVLTGGALLVLGAAGAVLALDSAGQLYPQGVVGLVAGAVLWLAGAYRGGLFSSPPRRPRRRYVEDDPHARTVPRRPARSGDTRKLPLPGEQNPARWGR
jgi:hypothetical protein